MLEVAKIEPELFWVCVPECIYRGGCPEMFKCKKGFFSDFLKFVGKDNFSKLFNISTRYDLYHEFMKGWK